MTSFLRLLRYFPLWHLPFLAILLKLNMAISISIIENSNLNICLLCISIPNLSHSAITADIILVIDLLKSGIGLSKFG